MNDEIRASQICRSNNAIWKIFRKNWGSMDMYEGANRGEYQDTCNFFQKLHHGWAAQLSLRLFLIIDIKIEYSGGGTEDKLTGDQRSDPDQNQGSWEPKKWAPGILHLHPSAHIGGSTLGFLALPS